MMNQRRHIQLRDLAVKITKGTTPTTLGHPFADSGINFIKAESVTRAGLIDPATFAFIDENTHRLLKRSQIEVDDILITIAGVYLGKVGLVRSEHVPANTNQAVAIIRIDKRLACPKYVRYFLFERGTTEYLNILCPQSAQPNLNLKQLGGLRLILPGILAQRKIAAVLAAYDDLIEANRRRIVLLERMAEELYREWFVRLRFPGHAKTKITKGVPMGWRNAKIPELAEITYGFPFDGARFNNEGRGKPIIRIRNIPDSSTSDFTDEEAAEKYIVRRGDLLIGMDGEFHINHWHGDDSYLVQRVCRLKAKQPVMDGYLAHAIRGPIKHYESILMGATVGHLGAMHLKAIDILLPSTEILERLAVFNDFDAQVGTLEQTNRVLTRTRDLLLPRLISGKLAVDALDIAFPPSLAAGG